MPLVRLVRSDCQGLATAIWIDQSDGHEVGVGHRVRFRDGQGVPKDLSDWAPYVDDLVSGLQESVCLLWQMVRDALTGSRIGLVDMHAVHRTTEGNWRGIVARRQVGSLVLSTTADRVVEDEDTRGASTAI